MTAKHSLASCGIAAIQSSSRWLAHLVTVLAVCAVLWKVFPYIALLLLTQPQRLIIQGPRFQHKGNHGAVTSENLLCSQAGTDAIVEGGTAADALVVTALCVGVVAMYHGGIGGGGFMLVRDTQGSYKTVDCREAAPATAFEDMFKDNEEASLVGGLASGVPGELMCLNYVHEQYGRLPWARLFEPAIKLAEGGFTVNEDLILTLEDKTVRPSGFLTKDPAWAIDFAPNGELVKLGDRMTRVRYAQTLREISLGGARAFYDGVLANQSVAALRAKNGILSTEDFRNYKAVIREPVRITYRDFQIISTGVPASGAVLLSALKIVEGYNDMGDKTLVNVSTHRMCEALKFAYGQRAELGDPGFLQEIEPFQSQMLNRTVAQNIHNRISDQHVLPLSAYNPKNYDIVEDTGTAHMIATDSEGLVITFTSTVNDYFGSHVMVPETGVIFNDQMNDFSIPNMTNAYGFLPSPANFIRPGKRPLSSSAPTIIEHSGNSSFYLATGATGGSRIISGVAQVLWAMLDQEMSSRAALKVPRFHDQLQPNRSEFQWDYDNATVAFMKSRGHNVTWTEPGSDAYIIKIRPDGSFEAATDPHLTAAGVSVV